MSTVLAALELFLPLVGSLLKIVLKDPTQYAKLKADFAEIDTDIQAILTGMN